MVLWTLSHHRTFGSGVFALVDSRHGVLIHLRSLDLVSLDVEGGDIGQVVPRWVAVDGASSWLSWRRQN